MSRANFHVASYERSRMSKQELAADKRSRRAERGPGFSNYAKGIPSSSARRAKLSNERAAARLKDKEVYEKSRTPEQPKEEREERCREARRCVQMRKRASARPRSK